MQGVFQRQDHCLNKTMWTKQNRADTQKMWAKLVFTGKWKKQAVKITIKLKPDCKSWTLYQSFAENATRSLRQSSSVEIFVPPGGLSGSTLCLVGIYEAFESVSCFQRCSLGKLETLYQHNWMVPYLSHNFVQTNAPERVLCVPTFIDSGTTAAPHLPTIYLRQRHH